jgi:hypothetical protein
MMALPVAGYQPTRLVVSAARVASIIMGIDKSKILYPYIKILAIMQGRWLRDIGATRQIPP